jgi:hypothetical protein
MIDFKDFTIEETNSILRHLGDGIYKEVAPIITKIHQQAIPQIEAQKKPPEAETVES